MLRRLLHNTLIIINILSALGLLVCYLSTHISPEQFWIPSVIALGYPFILAINIIFILYWTVRLKLAVLISITAIALGFNHLRAFARITFKNEAEDVADIGLITYNCNLFGVYQNGKPHERATQIIEYALREKRNLVCLQEFYVNERFGEDDVRRKLRMNSHISYIKGDGQKTGFGMATFSRFPIVRRGELQFANTNNGCIYTDITVNGDTIRIYNVHLQSIRLQEHHLQFIQNVGSGTNRDVAQAETSDIARRLHGAFVKRAVQADSIASHVCRCPYAVIICGDFNDPPVSYTYRRLAHSRCDAFIESGRGIMPTYRRLWSMLRIDHVLHSKQLRALHCHSPRLEYSDHFPVLTDFALN
ncbi:MAG: endonuclease/exonuclease/phosphatase family protein [Bacteroidales bacterium]|nr:endonuclease/exonuclease/phosphatase family protein [Bacteroidales bacterium]